MRWGLLHLGTGWHTASVTTFRGERQEDANPSVSSSCLAELSLDGGSRGNPGSHTSLWSTLCYHLLCEAFPVGFHVLDLKETLHL